jgi:hypothetical protein
MLAAGGTDRSVSIGRRGTQCAADRPDRSTEAPKERAMTVSATSGNNAELARLWQGLAAQGTSSTASSAGKVDADAAGKVGSNPLAGFRSKIEAAITAALQNAPAGTDPNKVIKDTLAGMFPADGKDAAKKAHKHHHQKGAAEATKVDPQQQDFLATLQRAGVSPAQFQSDLQSALSQSSGGNVDFAQVFRSFPPGTGVDSVA